MHLKRFAIIDTHKLTSLSGFFWSSKSRLFSYLHCKCIFELRRHWQRDCFVSRKYIDRVNRNSSSFWNSLCWNAELAGEDGISGQRYGPEKSRCGFTHARGHTRALFAAITLWFIVTYILLKVWNITISIKKLNLKFMSEIIYD